jgi:hypothetical protein
MLIEIKDNIFSGNDFRGLNFLIQLATYKHRYDLFVDLSLIQDFEFYKRLDYDDKSILEDYFNQSIQNSKCPQYIVSDTETEHFNLEEAIRFFIQPVSIILENSLNDAYFVKALMLFFDETGGAIRHLNNNWIQFENAGGCDNIINFIEGKSQSFNNLPKNNYQYLRVVTIMDSDRKFSNDILRANKLKTLRHLVNNSCSCHILRKRSMENYLPDEIFDLTPYFNNNKELVRIYKNFTNPFQKDFFDISKGFTNKKPNKMPKTRADLEEGIRNLYDISSVPDSDFEILDKGLQIGDFKSVFPKLFEHDAITKQNLLDRVMHQQKNNELQEIVDKILKLL